MSNTFGDLVKITSFGESHQPYIGVVIDDFPAGFPIDFDQVQKNLDLRKPGQNSTSTSRKESDQYQVISGIFEGKTDGSPIVAICPNQNTISKDYQPELIRPSHADLTAKTKYQNSNDYRGGGQFSGRLTANLVFAGSICFQYLQSIHSGLKISSQVISIGSETNPENFESIILDAKNSGDSVGGVIETRIQNFPIGYGSPLFNSVESIFSHLLFSIPAVKGIEFGDGFNLAQSLGSEVNDQLQYNSKKEVEYLSNHNGGILGGITTGQDIIFRVAIKPTPTISKPQKTINLATKQNLEHSFLGRHDPSIVLRARVVLETTSAIALINLSQ